MSYKHPPKFINPSSRFHGSTPLPRDPSFADVNALMTVEKISSNIVVNNELLYSRKLSQGDKEFCDEIKKNLINQMNEQLAQFLEVHVEKSTNMMEDCTKFTGSINITNKQCENVIVSDKQFVTDGQTFTFKELQDAVKNFFPERFI